MNTRIAPSPTGYMHIGTARTAYFNWLAAKASNGKFILRIDDTDTDRSKQQYVDSILNTMHWLSLDFDDIYYQSARLDRYKFLANDLIAKNLARVHDGCTKLSLNRNFPYSWQDEIAGSIFISNDDFANANDMILVRSNGIATYNFASVIDDMDFGIDCIIRGTDHITNTSKQVILWHILGYPLPKFYHIRLIAFKGKLLSKREQTSDIATYKNLGYDVDAMLNFLARMSWSPTKDDKSTTILSKDDMIRMFWTEGNMRNSQVNLDLSKLESYDRKYKAKKGIFRTKQSLLEI